MTIRTYKVTLDTKNIIAPEPVYLRQGDKTGAVVIDATLMDNGSPVSLDSLTPMFKANTADGQAVIADSTGFNVLDSANGEFTYQVPNALSSVPGKITTAYFSFSDSSGSESTFDVAFIIKKAVDITQEQADEYITIIDGTLKSLQQKIDAMNTDVQTILNAYNQGDFYSKAQTDSKDAATLTSAKSYADTGDSNALHNAKTYTDNSLSGIVALPETFVNLAAIKAKYPSGANGVMVAADNGHKYIWANSTWTDAGIYQAAGIAPNSVATEAIKQSAVTVNKIDGLTVNSTHAINRFDAKTAISGAMNANGFVDSKRWVHTNYIMVSSGAVVHINKAYKNYLCTYDKFGNFIQSYEFISDVKPAEVVLADNVKFIIVNCFFDYLDEFMVTINDPMPATYQPFTSATDNAEINWLYFKDNSISPAKLSGTKIVKRRSSNRYNEQSAVDGQTATINGIVNYVSRRRTDYLNVTPGDLITLSKVAGSDAIAAVGYDISKHPVISWDYHYEQGETSLIIPNNVFFIIINVLKDWSNFMFSINEPLPDAYEPFVENDIVDVSWISRSKFENKSAMMFGDSIAWYDGHAQPDGTIAVGYESWLENILGFTTVQNLGISGAPFAVGKTTDNGIGAKIKSEYKTTDLVLIAGGTNDFKLDVPLGEIQPVSGTFDKTTSTGALQSALEHILTVNNDQKILLMTPIQRDNSGYTIYSTNQAGFKLDDYRQMIIKLGELYSIPVWDGYAESGLNLLNLNKYTLDGLHPNNVGFERISKSLCAYIKGVF